MNIHQIIQHGEDSRTEFKSGDFHNDSLAKEVVAFSNMSGGDIFIGIDDNGVVQGVEDKNLEPRIINICRNNIVPPVIPEISFLHIEGKKILHLAVDKGRFKPFKVKSTNKYYIRAGSVSIEPTNEELIRLFQDGAQFHFEAASLPGTAVKDVDLLRFRLYCTDYRGLEWEDDQDFTQLLYNFQIIDDKEQLTVCGALFFAKNISRMLPQAGIEMNAFDGADQTADITDFKSDDTDIPSLIGGSRQFVKFNARTQAGFEPDDMRRIDQPDYDPFVIREVITNAFMHRDWSIFGQKIRLNIFTDRLEIFSPGAIPNTLNLTRALAGISYYRNPVIAQMLKDYKLAEKAGRGLQKILKIHQHNGWRAPDFDIGDAYFKVTLHNANVTNKT